MSGSLAPGDQLLSEPGLAVQHNMSRVTIRRALDGLARDGLIKRQPGAGTFVCRKVQNPVMKADLTNMLSHLAAMGAATKVKLLDFGYGVPPSIVRDALKLEPLERVQHSLRLRFRDNVPFSYLTTYVPERIGITYTEHDLSTTPLLSLLERSGVVLAKADQMISATLAGPETASALQVKMGSPLVSLTRIVTGADGRGVEYLSAQYRPDMHHFHMELTRAGDGSERHWQTNEITPENATSKLTIRRGTIRGRRRG